MADDVAVLEPQRIQAAERMIGDRLHRVSVIGLWIIGLALADLVDRNHMAAFAETGEIELPLCRAVRAVERAKITAVKQYDVRPRTSFEIPRPNTADIDEFSLA